MRHTLGFKMISVYILLIFVGSFSDPCYGSPVSIVNAIFNNDIYNKSMAVIPPADVSFIPLKYEYLRNNVEQDSFLSEDTNTHEEKLNHRPIIGILSQELSKRMENELHGENYTSYIAASYVKFVESAGARVVPIMINKTNDYYEKLGQSLNGFIFPGGSLPINSGYSKAAKKIFEIVTKKAEKGRHIPAVWATCLGFENLLYFQAKFDPRSHCKAINKADSLTFKPGSRKSQLFGKMPEDLLEALATKNVTTNFHTRCILPQTFNDSGLNTSLRLLTTSFDFDGVEYVSTIEHRQLPIFGTQWHPEKPAFEWADDPRYDAIPHTLDAIRVSQFLAETFIQKARQNQNHFISEEEEKKQLIYNYSPVYIASYYESAFEMCYFFK